MSRRRAWKVVGRWDAPGCLSIFTLPPVEAARRERVRRQIQRVRRRTARRGWSA